MDYEKAKTNFERLVTWMQDDLKKDASKPHPNQRSINTRMGVINQLVEYYEAVERRMEIIEQQWEKESWYAQRLHGDTQKLIYWCNLHRVKVTPVFYYYSYELEDLLRRKIYFDDLTAISDYQVLFKYEMTNSFSNWKRVPFSLGKEVDTSRKHTPAEIQEMSWKCKIRFEQAQPHFPDHPEITREAIIKELAPYLSNRNSLQHA